MLYAFHILRVASTSIIPQINDFIQCQASTDLLLNGIDSRKIESVAEIHNADKSNISAVKI